MDSRGILDTDIGDIQVVLPGFGDADAEEVKHVAYRASTTRIARTLEPHLDVDIENFPVQVRQYGPDPLSDPGNPAPAMPVADGHDVRIRDVLQPVDAVAAIAVNALEERKPIVSEVEEHQSPHCRRVDSQHRHVLATPPIAFTD